MAKTKLRIPFVEKFLSPMTVFFFILLSVTFIGQYSKAQTCQGSSEPCESAAGVGENDDCCHCAGNETLSDTDGNGYLDSCRDAFFDKDPCHGQYEVTFLYDSTNLVCTSNTACCRVPRRTQDGRRSACHGQEGSQIACIGGVEGGGVCCLGGKRIIRPR